MYPNWLQTGTLSRGSSFPSTDTESCCKKSTLPLHRQLITITETVNYHYRDRSVGMSAEKLLMQIQTLSWIPIKFRLQMQISGSKRINFVTVSARTVLALQNYIRKSCKKKEPKPKLLGPIFSSGVGGLLREGVGAKKFGMSLETRETKVFGRDTPGLCRDIPEAPEKFEKKSLCSIFGP